VGTLGGDGLSDLGVTTLGGNGALVVSCALIVVCDLVCRGRGMVEAKIGLDDLAGIVHSATMVGATGSVGG
jgi:hypothetical protein